MHWENKEHYNFVNISILNIIAFKIIAQWNINKKTSDKRLNYFYVMRNWNLLYAYMSNNL